MRILPLFLLAPALVLAQSWTGYLVDSGCYKNDKANHNISPSTVDRDMNMELKQCAPDSKTKSFALVLPDWSSLKLDTAGSTKATELVRNASHRTPIQVTLTGERSANEVKVDSISRAGQ